MSGRKLNPFKPLVIMSDETKTVGINQKLNDRMLAIVRLREFDKLTFKEIGKSIGICGGRASDLYKTAKRRQEWHAKGESGDPYYGLSTRAINICRGANLLNREQILEAVKDGRLTTKGRPRYRNYGWKTHVEIHKWLGLPEPIKSHRQPVKCPHCGAILR